MAVDPIEFNSHRASSNFRDTNLKLIENDCPQYDQELGYTLVPGGGLFSIEHLASIGPAYIAGLGRAAKHLWDHHSGQDNVKHWPEPERRLAQVEKHDRTLLITEPHPQHLGESSTATNSVLLPGLTEMDIGSAYRLHKAMARRHPERRTITVTTPGVSLGGSDLPVSEGLTRKLEATAAENLKLLPWLLKEGDIHLIGTSLGSYMVTLMAELNLAANNGSQLDVTHVKLLSPAVGARNIDQAEVGQVIEADANDRELIEEATGEFFAHMPFETLRQALRHPRAAGESTAVVAAYMLSPHRLLHRAAAIRGNLRGVQQGIEWTSIKNVARSHNLHILGGEVDPLIRLTIPQWKAIKEIAPATTKFWVVQDVGHAMTLNARGTATYLAHMERPEVS